MLLCFNPVVLVDVPRVHSHAACILGDTMLVYGGFASSTRVNDIYLLDLKSKAFGDEMHSGRRYLPLFDPCIAWTWSSPVVHGAKPTPAIKFMSVAIHSALHIFGTS